MLRLQIDCLDWFLTLSKHLISGDTLDLKPETESWNPKPSAAFQLSISTFNTRRFGSLPCVSGTISALMKNPEDIARRRQALQPPTAKNLQAPWRHLEVCAYSLEHGLAVIRE
jgi:hypothetical protein